MAAVARIGPHARYMPGLSAFTDAIRLSLAAPAYNEEQALRIVVEGWHRYLKAQRDVSAFEIVVCDDGSRDATGTILDELARRYGEIRPLHFQSNQGAAAALSAAITATTMDWVLLIDSDGQFPIDNFERMLAQARRQSAPAVIGIRRKQDSAFARFGTASSGLVCNLLHGSSIRDFNSAFKLIWGPLLRALSLEARAMNYSTEVTSRLLESGVTIAQVEIDHRPRVAGASSMHPVRDAVHRMLFVAYIGMRQLLLRAGILRRLLA